MLSIKNLSIHLSKNPIVQNISFDLNEGEIAAIVGGSGAGKSMTAMAIAGLLPNHFITSGKVNFEENNLLEISEEKFCKIRGKKNRDNFSGSSNIIKSST